MLTLLYGGTVPHVRACVFVTVNTSWNVFQLQSVSAKKREREGERDVWIS